MAAGKREDVKELLSDNEIMVQKLYGVYRQWVSRYSLACRKGCSACCTQSVTITTLEAETIVDFFSKKGEEKKLTALLAEIPPAANDTPMTTNQFARLCLEQREIDDDGQGTWNFAPCVFLADDVCTIYEVRPFGCRSFGSLAKCETGRPAEMASLHLTINTVFMQIIEHLNSGSGHWGYMTDILISLIVKSSGERVLPAQPLPGFLIDPSEEVPVNRLLSKLFAAPVGTKSFAELIDNSRLME